MLKLLELLQNIYLDKLLFKNAEFKAGFAKAIDIVKLHGFQVGIIQETRDLRIELEKSQREINFLKERLQLKKEEVKALSDKVNSQRTQINTLLTDSKGAKRLRIIAKKLNKNKSSDKKVAEVLEYIESIKQFKDTEKDES